MSGIGKSGVLTATMQPVEEKRITATTAYTGSSSKRLAMSQFISSWKSGLWTCAQAASNFLAFMRSTFPLLETSGTRVIERSTRTSNWRSLKWGRPK